MKTQFRKQTKQHCWRFLNVLIRGGEKSRGRKAGGGISSKLGGGGIFRAKFGWGIFRFLNILLRGEKSRRGYFEQIRGGGRENISSKFGGAREEMIY